MRWSLYQLLCRWSVGFEQPETLPLPQGLAEWRSWLELAREQQVEGLLASRLRRASVLDKAPEEIAGELRVMEREMVRRNLQLYGQAIKLARRLNGVEIRPVFLKGTAFTLGSREPDFGLRQQLDIDILLPEDCLERAARALLDDGYGFSIGRAHAPEYDATSPRAINASHHHMAPLVKPGYAAPVELHRHYLSRAARGKNSLSELLEAMRDLERHGARFAVPDPVTALVQIILGTFVNDGYARARDFPIRAGTDFVALADAAQLTPDDWQELRRRCGPALDLFLAVLSELTGFGSAEMTLHAPRAHAWMRGLRRRYQRPSWARWMDRRARLLRLLQAIFHSPGKLPGFLGRNLGKRAESAPQKP